VSELRDHIAGMAYTTLAKVSKERDELRTENIRLRAEIERARRAVKYMHEDVMRLVGK
jgi:hypothetical protein